MQVEKALFYYFQQQDPEMLETKGWQMAEQGEIPCWEDYISFHKIHAEQDSLKDEDKDLSVDCLRKCPEMRNDAEHRKMMHGDSLLGYIHNAIKTLIALDDFNAALEVEIQAEQWFTGSNRQQTFARLQFCYRKQDLSSVKGIFARSLEGRRRDAISKCLDVASLVPTHSPMMEPRRIIDAQQSLGSNASSLALLQEPAHCLPSSAGSSSTDSCSSSDDSDSISSTCSSQTVMKVPLPDEITYTKPDVYDFRQVTFSEFMHRNLKISAPETKSEWLAQDNAWPPTIDSILLTNVEKELEFGVRFYDVHTENVYALAEEESWKDLSDDDYELFAGA